MKRWILYIVLCLIVFFIWDNSLQNGGTSYVVLRRYIEYGTVVKTIGVGIVIASLDEFIQLFSLGRSSQLSDVLIDTVGIIIGISVVKLTYYISHDKR